MTVFPCCQKMSSKKVIMNMLLWIHHPTHTHMQTHTTHTMHTYTIHTQCTHYTQCKHTYTHTTHNAHAHTPYTHSLHTMQTHTQRTPYFLQGLHSRLCVGITQQLVICGTGLGQWSVHTHIQVSNIHITCRLVYLSLFCIADACAR